MVLTSPRPERLSSPPPIALPGPADTVSPESHQQPLAGAIPVRRVLMALACIGLLRPAFNAWGSFFASPAIGVASVVICVLSIVGLSAALALRSENALDRLDLGILALGVFVIAVWGMANLHANSSYGTDEAALLQGATSALLHGRDPYGLNLLGSMISLHVPIQYATYLLNGGLVTTFGYPAFPILFLLPFYVLTHGVQAEPIAMLAGMTITLIVGWLSTPKAWRPLVIVVVVGLPILFGYAVAGVTTLLLAPMIVVARNGFSVSGFRGLNTRGWISALCLGLGVATSQLAWFMAPFFLVGVWEYRRREVGAKKATALLVRYALVAGLPFLLINLPFLVWNPHAFLLGIAAPLIQKAIPYGQGLIDLPTFLGIGGGSLSLFTYAAVTAYIGLGILYVLFFDRLWRLAPVLAVLPLILSTRSLAEYWMTPIVIWFVALAATEVPPIAVARSRRLRLIAPVVMLPAVICVAGALLTVPPLTLSVQRVWSNGQDQRVWQAALLVTNRTSNAIVPHYAADSIGQTTSFWTLTSGPSRLAPHQSALVTLSAPNEGSMPAITSPFVMEAVAAKPASVMISKPYVAAPYGTEISYNYATPTYQLGGFATLSVALTTPFGATVRRSGVAIALGQVVYGSSTLIPGEASINSHAPGESPIVALTNRQGVATFRVTDQYDQKRPVYFQAWVQAASGNPFGYSSIVAIRWR